MVTPSLTRTDKGNDASAVAATVLRVVPRSDARTHLLWCPSPRIWAAEVRPAGTLGPRRITPGGEMAASAVTGSR